MQMKALFIGQSYIDITFLTDELPTGDEKTVARDYAVSFGGNAVTAAFCCAKLGDRARPDRLGRRRLARPHVHRHGGEIRHLRPSPQGARNRRCRSSCRRAASARSCAAATTISNIRFRCSISPAAARCTSTGTCRTPRSHYAKICHEAGILTSLDGGGLRSNTHDLLAFIGTAVVAERLCEQMKLTPGEMLTYLRSRGCRIGGVTMGAKGLLWYDETGERAVPAGAQCPRAPGHRHQRRRRHLSWRLHVFVSDRSRCRAGSSTSSSRARHRPIRSSISATKRACRRSAQINETAARFGERRQTPVELGLVPRARQARDQARNRAPLV